LLQASQECYCEVVIKQISIKHIILQILLNIPNG